MRYIVPMKSMLQKIGLFCLVVILGQVPLLFAAKNLSTPSRLPQATKITDIKFQQKDAVVTIIIKGNGPMKPKVYTWSNLIVIDIPDVTFNAKVPVKMVSPVKEVKAGKHKGKTRLVFYLEEMKKFDVSSRQNTIIIALKNTAPALKSTGPHITAGQKETPQEQKKSEIIEKREIKPVEIEASTSVVKESKGPETRLEEADSVVVKNTAPHIPVEEQEASREQPKPEIIEKEGIEAVSADTSVAAGTVKESKGAEIRGKESDTSKDISNDSSGKEYIIGPEDVLDIQVWGNDDLKRTVEVSQEGAFTFPLIDKVYAKGLTVFELEQLLKERLADGYLKEPQVNVTVSKYKNKKVVLLGEVRKPGTYVIKGRTHILELISEAEGLTDRAGSIITIVRPQLSPRNYNSSPLSENVQGSKTVEVDLDNMATGASDDSFFVQEGDSIYVSKAPPIFVTGEVNKPGEFKWEKHLTGHHAISLAGGPTRKGALNRVKIYRTENGKEKTFKADLDEMIMPYDIIQVPESYF